MNIILKSLFALSFFLLANISTEVFCMENNKRNSSARNATFFNNQKKVGTTPIITKEKEFWFGLFCINTYDDTGIENYPNIFMKKKYDINKNIFTKFFLVGAFATPWLYTLFLEINKPIVHYSHFLIS